jgi:hypothetical protein
VTSLESVQNGVLLAADAIVFLFCVTPRPVPVTKEPLRQWIAEFLLEGTTVEFGCSTLTSI